MKRPVSVSASSALLAAFLSVSAVLLTFQTIWFLHIQQEALSGYKQRYLVDQSRKLASLARDRLQPASKESEEREWLDRAARQYAAVIRFVGPDERQANDAAARRSFGDRPADWTGGEVWHASRQLEAAEPFVVTLPIVAGGEHQGWLEMTYDLRSDDAFPYLVEASGKMRRESRRALLAALLAAAAAGAVLALRLARPFTMQAASAERVIRGDRRLVFPGKGWKEAGKVGAAVNALLEECRHQERWRQRMMQDLMHELRTPLTLLQARMEAMQDGIYPLTMQNVARVNAELDRLSRFVDDMNKLSEAEAAKFQLRLERTELMDLLREVWESFLFAASEKNIRLVLVPSYTPCVAEVDADRIVQIISNLLSNAVKYTPEGGLVELGVRREPAAAVIYCRDNGEGIAAEELPNIFERFHRARQSAASPGRGLGVGLSIVRALAEAHGGAVAVESAPGRGSLFTVTIPANGGDL